MHFRATAGSLITVSKKARIVRAFLNDIAGLQPVAVYGLRHGCHCLIQFVCSGRGFFCGVA